MRYPGFVGPAYRSQSRAAADDLLFNLYAEVLESEGASPAVFYGTPGSVVFAPLTKGPVREIVSLPGAEADYCYAVAGDSLYLVNHDGTFRLLGSGLPGGTSPVSMQTNGNQVAIAAGGVLWVWAAGVLKPVDPVTVPGAGTVSYSDGYFIVNVPGTNQFYISGLFDATSWNALDFGAKGGFPDLVVGQIVDHRELWLCGSRTMEIWWNSGNALFPWERLQGPFIESGLAAQRSLVKADNTHLWLGKDERGGRMFWKANGYAAQRISTFAVEFAMSTYVRVDDAIAYSYQELGHTFYVVSFPSATAIKGLTGTSYLGATWVLDLSNNQWHQRDYLNPDKLFMSDRVRGQVHAYAFGKHLVGDFENGNIYEQSSNYYTDAGARIRRLRRAPHLNQEHKRVFYQGFELLVQQGVVPQAGPGSAPVFNLRKSKDGGFTWTQYIQANGGSVGQYQRRVFWRRLGNARDAVFEVTSDEPIQHVWLDAYLNPDPVVGTS